VVVRNGGRNRVRDARNLSPRHRRLAPRARATTAGRDADRPAPDWVCEILSASNAKDDQVTKFETYRRCGVPHYWIADPALLTLRVFRWTPDGDLVALTAEAGQSVRAEPFDAVELEVGVLFGGDPEQG